MSIFSHVYILIVLFQMLGFFLSKSKSALL